MNGEGVPTNDLAAAFERLRRAVGAVVIGQDEALRFAFLTLLCSGHSLIEGVPGVAKTLLVRALSAAVGIRFGRIQFTPDLLPSDIVGTPVFHPATGEVRFRSGPIFTTCSSPTRSIALPRRRRRRSWKQCRSAP